MHEDTPEWAESKKEMAPIFTEDVSFFYKQNCTVCQKNLTNAVITWKCDTKWL